MLLADHAKLTVGCFELECFRVFDEVGEVEAAEVGHQLRVGGVREEQEHTDGLHQETVGEDDDAASGVHLGQAAGGVAGAVEKERERFGCGAVEICGVAALPVCVDVGQLLFFMGAVVAGWFKIGELVNGPILDGDIGKPL